jgi:hypothetical protein
MSKTANRERTPGGHGHGDSERRALKDNQKRQLNEYLQRHDIERSVQSMLNELANAKPADPVAFMSQWLGAKAQPAPEAAKVSKPTTEEAGLREAFSSALASWRKHLDNELLPYWSTRGHDSVHGGCLTFYDADGKAGPETWKNLLAHARCIYTFSSLSRFGRDSDGIFLKKVCQSPLAQPSSLG